MKTLKFKNGNEAPVLGFGTWKLEGKECEVSVKQALEIGYRHIDTADKYGNHEFVGKALRSSGINRKEIFLTTKVWHSELKGGDVRKSALRFLEELQTDYLDLLYSLLKQTPDYLLMLFLTQLNPQTHSTPA